MGKRLSLIIYIFLAGAFFIPQRFAGFFVSANLSGFTQKKWIANAAEVPAVVINEVMWMGSIGTGEKTSSKDEWIELRNMTSQDVDLTGWAIEGAASNGGALIIPDDSIEHIIPAGGFYLISYYSIADRVLDTAITVINVITDLKIKSISLANSYKDNGQLILKDKSGNLIDQTPEPAPDSVKWPAGEYKSKEVYRSMERNDVPGDGTQKENWHTCSQAVNLIEGAIECGTARAENSKGAAVEGGEGKEVKEGEESGITNNELGVVEGEEGEEEEKLRNKEIEKLEEEGEEEKDNGLGRDGVKKISLNHPPRNTAGLPPLKKGEVIKGKIVINEIFPNPEGVDLRDEFVELKNIGGSEIDILGWIIKNKASQYKIVKNDFNITIIPAGGILALGRNITNIALNNNGDQVEIFSNDEKKIDGVSYNVYAGEGCSYVRSVDKWQWTSAITAGKENFFIAPNSAPRAIADFGGIKETVTGKEIIFDGSDSFDPDGDALTYEWKISDGAGNEDMVFKKKFLKAGEYEVRLKVTDKFANEGNILAKIKVLDNDLQTDDIYSTGKDNGAPIEYESEGGDIIIAAALPNPEGADGNNEWIKLYNNENFDVNLGGWIIDDMEGGSKPYYIPNDVFIKAENYFILSKDKTGVALNNDADEIRLFSPDGNLKDIKEYGTAKDGEVIEFADTMENQETGDINAAAYNGVSLNIEWENFKNYTGREVMLEGNVSASPQTLGAQEFYFTDGLGGVRVYCYKKDFPDLSRGDYISVSGVLSYKDGWQLTIAGKDDISVLSYDHPPLSREMKCDGIKNEDVYSLIMVKGEIVEKKGQTIYLDDDTGEIKIYIRDATGISSKGLTSGKKMSVIGILDYLNNEFRILPRDQDDLVLDDSQDVAASIEETSSESDAAFGADDNYGKVLGAMDAQCKDGACDAPAALKNSKVYDAEQKKRNLIIYLSLTLVSLTIVGVILWRRI